MTNYDNHGRSARHEPRDQSEQSQLGERRFHTDARREGEGREVWNRRGAGAAGGGGGRLPIEIHEMTREELFAAARRNGVKVSHAMTSNEVVEKLRRALHAEDSAPTEDSH